MKKAIIGAIIGFLAACAFFRWNAGTCFEWVDNDSEAPQCQVYWRVLG